MRRPTTGWTACALSCAFWVSTAVQAAPGDWDRSFAQNGRLNFEIPGVTFTVRDWVQQPDGRIVIVGHTTTGHSFSENREIIVARFSTNGTPDASFDSDGYVVFDFGGSSYGGTVNLARQTDGKLLIAGQAGVDYNEARVVRLNVDGSRDAGYGTAGEVSILYPTSTTILNPELKLAPNGSAIVVGRFWADLPTPVPESVVATRLTTAGVPDATFGTGGNAFLQGTDHLFPEAVAIAADGSIIVGGTIGPFNDSVPFVGRIRSTGQPDTSFGAAGIVVVPFLIGEGYVTSVATDTNGKVLLSGIREDSFDFDLPFIARFNLDGSPDASFGSTGRIIVGGGEVTDLLIDGDKIVATGISNQQYYPAQLSRYNADGSPDVTFGVRGATRTDFSTGHDSQSAQLRLPRRNDDGSYTTLVTMYNGSEQSFALARFRAQGASAGVLGIYAEYEASPNGPNFSVSEETPTQRFFVQRTGGTEGAVTVQYRTVSDTAIAGQDFVAMTGTITLNDGETSAFFDVAVIDDVIPETNFPELFHAELFGPTGGAGLSKESAAIRLYTDQDWGQRLQVFGQTGSFIEGGTARVLLYRFGDMRGPLTLNYTITAGTASAGSDYTGTGGTVQWPDNEGGAREISVPLVGDTNAETSEQFTITFSDPNNIVTAPSPSTITITDDDGITDPSVAFAASNVFVNENAGSVTFTVLRFGNATQALSIPWTTHMCSGQGAAESPQDYTASSSTLDWAAGDTTPKTITIPLIDDSTFEAMEGCGAGINLSYPPAATLLNVDNNVSFSIKDNDGTPGQPVASLGAGSTVSEGAGTLTIPVTLSGLPPGPYAVSVDWQFGDETASSNDVGAVYGTLYWPVGDHATKNISIPITQDTRDEIDETFSIQLSRPQFGATIGTASARFTITDDDPTPAGQPAPAAPGVQAVSSVTVAENQHTASVELRRVGDTSGPLSVLYTALDGTAGSPGDFVSPSGYITWEPNETTIKRAEVQINGDTVAEPTETLTLRAVAYAVFTDLNSIDVPITITDDDAPAPPARVAFINAAESAAESAVSVTIQVGRTGNVNVASSVDYAMTAGTATAADFTSASGTLTWAAGDASSKMITVTLLPDTVDEPNETFTITLSNPSSGTQIDAATVTVTIQDDDVPPTQNPPSNPPSTGGGGGGGGGAETPLGLLALASILLLRTRTRRRA